MDIFDCCQNIGKHYKLECGSDLNYMADAIKQYAQEEIKRFIPYYEIAKKALQKDGGKTGGTLLQ